MRKVKCILFLLLCCGVLTCTSSVPTNSWYVAAKEKERRKQQKELKERRIKAKMLFPDLIEYDKIGPEYFDQYEDDYLFKIRFSNLIYKSGDGLTKIPIFRGTMGDVLYADFKEYCHAKGLINRGDAVSGFYIEFEKGEYNKVLKEFKDFYGSRLSINFKEKPAKILFESAVEEWHTYVFTLDGIDWELSYYYYTTEYYRNETTKLYYAIR